MLSNCLINVLHILKKLKLMFALIFVFSSSATGVKFDLEFVHIFTQTKKKLTFHFSYLLGIYFGLILLSKFWDLNLVALRLPAKISSSEKFVFIQRICV